MAVVSGENTLNSGAQITWGTGGTFAAGATSEIYGPTDTGLFISGGTATAGNALTLTGGLATAGAGGAGSLTGGAGVGTDRNAGGAIVSTGASTGTGVGNLVLRTPYNTTSGTQSNTPVDRVLISGKALALSTTNTTATTFATYTMANNSSGGVWVVYSIGTTDGTEWQTATGHFTVSSVNKAGTVTSNAATVTSESTIATSGTLTIASATTVTATTVNLRVTPTWAVITPTTVTIRYSIFAFGEVTSLTPS